MAEFGFKGVRIVYRESSFSELVQESKHGRCPSAPDWREEDEALGCREAGPAFSFWNSEPIHDQRDMAFWWNSGEENVAADPTGAPGG